MTRASMLWQKPFIVPAIYEFEQNMRQVINAADKETD